MAVACVQRRLYEMTLTSHTGSMRTVMVSVSKSDGWITNEERVKHMYCLTADTPSGNAPEIMTRHAGGGDFAETATSDRVYKVMGSEVLSGSQGSAISAGKGCLVDRRDDKAHGVAALLHYWHMQQYNNKLASWVLVVVD